MGSGGGGGTEFVAGDCITWRSKCTEVPLGALLMVNFE